MTRPNPLPCWYVDELNHQISRLEEMLNPPKREQAASEASH